MGVLEDLCRRDDLQDYMRAMTDAGFLGSAVMAAPFDHQRALNHNISVQGSLPSSRTPTAPA